MSDTTSGSGTGAEAPRVLGGRYEVGSLLGRGGMAEVHVARDTRLSRMVAVKLLRSDLARDPSFQARFRREAQAAAGLNHPSIVAVYDTGADQSTESGGSRVDLPWIVMEYVEGRTLRDVLRAEHPLALTEALTITEGVLNALEYSHRMGIVHRDIKPANVMITPAGEVKVMDFGIARAVSDSSATLTQTSAVMGTAQYLSPEQARGEQVDARSDLYSAGCLLYEILTGRPPFVGDAPVAVAYQHVSEQPRPPSAFAPQLPPAVDHVVLMALSKDREHRYQSAGDFADDLRRAVEGRPLRGASFTPPVDATQAFSATGAAAAAAAAGPATAATTVTPPVRGAYPATGTGPLPVVEDGDVPPAEEEQRKRWPWVLLVVLLVLGIGAAVYALNQPSDTPSPTPSPSVSTPATVAAPDLANRMEDQAKGLLEEAELVGDFRTAPSDTVAEGTVISSDPAAGTPVEIGGTVVVTVSSGPSSVAVPNLSDMTQAQARTALSDVGLVLGDITSTDSFPKADKGAIVTWDSQGGSVARGTTINVEIASGQVSVPEVTGQTLAAAQKTLNDAGLQVNSGPADSTEGTPGTVATQSQSPGSKVDVGTLVQVTVYPQPSASPTTSATATATPTDGASDPSASPSGSSSDQPSDPSDGSGQ